MLYLEITYLLSFHRLPSTVSSFNNSSPTNHPGNTEPHLDIHQLDETVRGYFAAALAPSTHKTYAAAERRYLTFCKFQPQSSTSQREYTLLLCSMPRSTGLGPQLHKHLPLWCSATTDLSWTRRSSSGPNAMSKAGTKRCQN